MERYYILGLVVITFFLFLFTSIKSRKEAQRKRRKHIREAFGSIPKREYEHKEFEKITHYFLMCKKKKEDCFYIDDITWNDLDMDSIFMMLNNTYSSAGEEYLYKLLRTPCMNNVELKKRDDLISYFEKNKESSYMLSEEFASLGRTKNISLSDFIYRLTELGERSNLSHYIKAFLMFASIITLFVSPLIGLAGVIIMLFINVSSYYSEKAKIESYFICFKYLVDMIICGENIRKINIKELDEYNQTIDESLKKLNSLKKGIFMLSMSNTGNSIGEIGMEYIRMIFHVDIVKFNSMLHNTIMNLDAVDQLFENIGKIDSAISIASFRTCIVDYTKPELDSNKPHMCFKGIYHPMITNPVVNDLDEQRSVLLTGSNASGKSTFLKTVAINSILAQTIYTATAKEFHSSFFRIYTSMALRDDLQSAESYYIVEIKSLKRIIDGIQDDIPSLCFIDEVLRGTNTVERIAASSYILKTIASMNALCFAATHDIELTDMIDSTYSNYHFTEDIKNDDVIFSYKLFSGKATSRNAIKLLNVMGFDKCIVNNAEMIASNFIKTGNWEKI